MPESGNYYIGLMSGTSLDGIDCAIVDLDSAVPRVVSAQCHPLPDALRQDLLDLCAEPQIALAELGRLDIELGRAFAAASNATLAAANIGPEAIRAIGSHGQTVFHAPASAAPFSLQIGDANVIAEATGIATVADFRRRDMAAGGQGAPLAPLLHRVAFASPGRDRAIVNIGGIANLTALPATGTPLAFDTGPGNVLMDYWTALHRGKRYDEDGDWARGGSLDDALLQRLRGESYFSRPAPKSTGRELFNHSWLQAQLESHGQPVGAQDVQATLLEFTAGTLSDAITAHLQAGEVFLCGGGAHNAALRERITALTPGFRVAITSELGLDPDWVEAAAFAWMAKQTLDGVAAETPVFTGARHPVILGGVYYSAGKR